MLSIATGSNIRSAIAVFLAFAGFLYGATAGVMARASEGVEVVPLAISRVAMEAGCGPTPVPGQPPATCPTTVSVRVVYLGYGCKPEDFEIRVRQRPDVQMVTIFKRSSASSCVIGSYPFFQRSSVVGLDGSDLVFEKPIRLVNPVPTISQVRP